MNSFVPVEIDETLAPEINTQNYSPKVMIDGVKIIQTKKFVGEEGDFSEIFRISKEGLVEGFPEFKVAQINRTKLIGGSVKGWHLHLVQNEIWHMIPDGHLFVGLWDIRKNSPTRGKTMRISVGEGIGYLVFIPRGVAHGAANFTPDPVNLLYFVSEQFNHENPDEKRIERDALGDDFWTPQE